MIYAPNVPRPYTVFFEILVAEDKAEARGNGGFSVKTIDQAERKYLMLFPHKCK